MVEIVEDRLVQQFVAYAAVERLADAVLRLARRDEMPSDAAALSPGEHRVRGELGPVIGDDQVRFAAPGDGFLSQSRSERHKWPGTVVSPKGFREADDAQNRTFSARVSPKTNK
jgi:hypothetical protein